jgi:hypothetical protein
MSKVSVLVSKGRYSWQGRVLERRELHGKRAVEIGCQQNTDTTYVREKCQRLKNHLIREKRTSICKWSGIGSASTIQKGGYLN